MASLKPLLCCLLVSILAACTETTDVGPGPEGPVGPVGEDGESIAGSGTIVTDERGVGTFDRVIFSSEGDVRIIQSGGSSLSIEADDNLLGYLETDVTGGTLTIATASGTDIDPTQTIRFVVGTTDLVAIEFRGVGSLGMDGWTTTQADIAHAGTGDITISGLQADSLQIELSAVGDLEIAGEVTNQTVTSDGVGEYRAGDLASQNAVIDASGTGDMTVWVTDTLDIVATETGSVAYYGEPSLTEEVSGTASVTALGGR